MQIKAYYEKSLYSNNSFHVFMCSTSDSAAAIVPQKNLFAKKEKYVFPVVLKDYVLDKEMDKSKKYVFYGDFKETSRGISFNAYSFEESIGESKEEIISFLTDLDGIGLTTAKLIYSAYGKDTLLKLREDVETNLISLKIPAGRVKKIVASYNSKFGFKEALDYFKKFSLSLNKIRTIYETYRETSAKT